VATTLPTAAISYSTTNITNQNVVVTLNPSEPIQEPLQYVYSGNGDYTITFTDLAGNVGSVVAHIANIDKD
jgi:thiamine monophosphate kinase